MLQKWFELLSQSISVITDLTVVTLVSEGACRDDEDYGYYVAGEDNEDSEEFEGVIACDILLGAMLYFIYF